jgi:hypothetical protein
VRRLAVVSQDHELTADDEHRAWRITRCTDWFADLSQEQRMTRFLPTSATTLSTCRRGPAGHESTG